VTFHTLRHTFASHLVMSGADLVTVKELMGHRDIEMTMRYTHLSPDHKVAAVKPWTPPWDTRQKSVSQELSEPFEKQCLSRELKTALSVSSRRLYHDGRCRKAVFCVP
jgi:hypothetical protein